MSPRLSVITICRNVRVALERTAASVLAQRDPRIEYWVVDGGSTDGTLETLATLEAQGARTLSESDRGISDAMNKGVRLASGDWVAHLHADDTYLPGALARMLEEIERDDADVLCGWMIKHEDTGDILCRCDPARLPLDMTVNHPATFVRRALFEQHGGFDPALRNAMDYDFFLRLFLAGARFRVVPFAVSHMMAGGQSERSLWKTLRETHEVRVRRLPSGFSRTTPYLWGLYLKGSIRIALQGAGLNDFVRWWRKHIAWPPKG